MTRTFSLAAALVLVGATLVGCDGPSAPSGACTRSSECHAGAICIDGHCMAPRDAGAMDGAIGDGGPRPDEVVSIRVEPATATLSSVDGASVSQTFTLIGVQRDGMEHPLTGATWNLDTIRVGTIDARGVFTADGSAGGASVVTATIMLASAPATATANVIVDVRRTILGAGAPTDVSAHFGGAGVADPTAIAVLYPLEGAMMPANVYPPTIQWAPVGAAGDFFRVTVRRPHATIVAYLVADAAFGHGWPADVAAWHVIANSDPDSDVSITVDRFETSTSRMIAGAAARTMHLARGNLFGSVYYEHRSGNASILRIHAETAVRETLIPSPPPLTSGSRCIGCHALTRDGRYVFAETTELDGVYDLTTDLTTDPPAPRGTPFPTAGAWYVASFDPDGTYFVAGSHVSAGLGIFDAATGAAATATGLPSAGTGYPSWSPDGMHIAYAGDVVTAPAGHPEPGDPIGGNLYVIDRMSATGLDFATPRMVHDGASLSSLPEGGTNDTHATWSPDGLMIAFQHGVGTFTHVVRNPGALYMLGLDGALHRLDHANGMTGADGYWPTFAPYVTSEAGGRSYYWMAFYTRRDYGNAILGTLGTQVRQLWVIAIDTRPTAGADPSLVPYWLPGQDIRTSNFSAFWAPEACRATAADCTTSSECCSGRCAMDASGASHCVMPPECHHAGEMCGGDGDCCPPSRCHGNVCSAGGPS